MMSAPSRDSAGVLEPLASACALHVDAPEEHGQLRRLEFDAVVIGSGIRGSNLALPGELAARLPPAAVIARQGP
jgi:hypothetical protein